MMAWCCARMSSPSFSARPSRIKEVLEVDIPRPRDVTSDAFVSLQRVLLKSLDAEVERMMRFADS